MDEDISVFQEKDVKPSEQDLREPLKETLGLWQDLRKFVLSEYPKGILEWNYPGKKYGWSYRIKDKKRAIIYFLPRNKYFKVAFVFGQKAFDEVMKNKIISQGIKTSLREATKYVEGRGVRIEVRDSANFTEIQELIRIKLAN